jgi:hypothetical protein
MTQPNAIQVAANAATYPTGEYRLCFSANAPALEERPCCPSL